MLATETIAAFGNESPWEKIKTNYQIKHQNTLPSSRARTHRWIGNRYTTVRTPSIELLRQ